MACTEVIPAAGAQAIANAPRELSLGRHAIPLDDPEDRERNEAEQDQLQREEKSENLCNFQRFRTGASEKLASAFVHSTFQSTGSIVPLAREYFRGRAGHVD